MRKRLIVTTVVTAALMLLPAAASASTDIRHTRLRTCPATRFQWDHNPGVLHRGASSWIPCDHAPTK